MTAGIKIDMDALSIKGGAVNHFGVSGSQPTRGVNRNHVLNGLLRRTRLSCPGETPLPTSVNILSFPDSVFIYRIPLVT